MGVKIFAAYRDVFWSDEMISLEFARDPSWTSIFWDNSPPLFPLILKLWTKIFSGDFAIKLLPVIFSSMTPFVLYRITRTFYPGRAAAVVLVIASCHLMSLHYATEVRPYSLSELLAAVQLYFYFSYYRRRENLRWYVSFSLALLLTQYSSVVLIAAQTVVFIRRRDLAPRARALLLVAFTVLVCLGAVLYFVVLRRNNLAHLRALDWRTVWFTPIELWLNLHSYSSVFAAISAYAIFNQRGRLDGIGLVIFLSVFATLAIVLLTGLAATRDRYFIFLIPSIVLSLSLYAAALPRSIFALMTAPLLILFAFAVHRHLVGGYEKSDWRRAANVVPADSKNVVLLFEHRAIKNPYWRRHETVFWNGQLESLPVEHAKNFWLLYPKYKCGVEDIARIHEFLIGRGFSLIDQGTFSRDAFERVDFKRYKLADESSEARIMFRSCIDP